MSWITITVIHAQYFSCFNTRFISVQYVSSVCCHCICCSQCKLSITMIRYIILSSKNKPKKQVNKLHVSQLIPESVPHGLTIVLLTFSVLEDIIIVSIAFVSTQKVGRCELIPIPLLPPNFWNSQEIAAATVSKLFWRT